MSTVSRLVVPVDGVWADNWVGAPNRGAAPRLPMEAMRGGNVVPLRRLAAVQPPAAEPEDLAMPVEPPAPRTGRHRLMAGGAGITVLAVLAGLWLGSGRRAEPTAQHLVGVTAPTQAVAAAVPVTPTPVAAPPVAPVQAMTATPVLAPPVVVPPPVVQRPVARPVRVERPARSRPPAKPAQRAAPQRATRG